MIKLSNILNEFEAELILNITRFISESENVEDFANIYNILTQNRKTLTQLKFFKILNIVLEYKYFKKK